MRWRSGSGLCSIRALHDPPVPYCMRRRVVFSLGSAWISVSVSGASIFIG